MSNTKKPIDLSEVEVTVSNRTVFRVLVMVLLSVVFFAAIQKATPALVLLFTAFFLALALNAPVNWIASRLPGKKRGNRTLGTAISFIAVIALLFGFFASFVPPLVMQTGAFLESAPQLVQDLRSEDSPAGTFVRDNNLEGRVDQLSEQLSGRLDNIGGAALSTVSAIGSSLFATITVLVLTFMMLVESANWKRIAKEFVPNKRRDHVQGLMRDMYKVIKGYVNGQVLMAAVAAMLLVVPMIILDIKYPIALMVIVFICGLIPMVGHTIGMIIVTTVALFTSLFSAIAILTFYVLYQQIENYIIQPRVQSNATKMSPLLVFTSVIIGVNFGGLLGGLVAIPLAGCIRILVLDYLHRHDIITKKSAVKLV